MFGFFNRNKDNIEVSELDFRKQGDTILIDLKNNKIKDEYGREIKGVAIGKCNRCGSEYRRLMIVGDDGISGWSEWCGDCDLHSSNGGKQEQEAKK